MFHQDWQRALCHRAITDKENSISELDHSLLQKTRAAALCLKQQCVTSVFSVRGAPATVVKQGSWLFDKQCSLKPISNRQFSVVVAFC
jgi:hypothetical protein